MRKLCIFIGATSGKPQYEALARNFALAVVRRNIGIVYGGSSDGLMGLIANTVLEQGGHVEGVFPRSLLERERPHAGLSKLHIVADMAQRKKLMTDLSDGFVALPGGLGTLEELFEVWNAAKIGLHAKPCGLLNGEGFYDHLLKFIDHAATEKFLKPEAQALLHVSQGADELLNAMEFFAAAAAQPAFK